MKLDETVGMRVRRLEIIATDYTEGIWEEDRRKGKIQIRYARGGREIKCCKPPT